MHGLTVLVVLLVWQGNPIFDPPREDRIDWEEYYDGLPSIESRDNFPGLYAIMTQIDLCADFEKYLAQQYRLSPLPATWQAMRQIRQARVMWQILEASHQTHLLSDEARRSYLRDYREMIGHYRYKKGWHPALLDTDAPYSRKHLPYVPPKPAANNTPAG